MCSSSRPSTDRSTRRPTERTCLPTLSAKKKPRRALPALSGSLPRRPVPAPWSTVAAASADGAAAAEGATEGAVASVAQGPQGASVAVPLGGMAFVQPQPQVTPEMEEAAKEMEEATANYIDELRNLTEMLAKVSEQSQRLTRDSEEMENLNRTLTGICKVYEMQLKGASAQIGTIDQINEQSRRMAEQIAELNAIYSRMIEAMTVNMKAAAPLKD